MPTAASIKQCAKRKADRHARGLQRPGRPRNDPDRLVNAPTGRPAGRPRGLIPDDFTKGLLQMMKEYKRDGVPMTCSIVLLPGQVNWTMEQALDHYQKYLQTVVKGEAVYPYGGCYNYQVGSVEELLEYHSAKIRMEREFFPKWGTMPYWLRGTEEPPSNSSAPEQEPTQEPAIPAPIEGEKYKPYIIRVAAALGVDFFIAQRTVKSHGSWANRPK
jgi:hypothetical protein